MIYEAIAELVRYGMKTGLIEKEDAIYARNAVMEVLHLEEYEDVDLKEQQMMHICTEKVCYQVGPKDDEYLGTELEEILKKLLDYACEQGICEDSVVYRDLLDTKLMSCLVPRPSEVIARFREFYADSAEAATDYYYKLSRDTDYIRRYRVRKDQKWTVDTEYGTLDITINLSKPEKDPKAIAAAKAAKQSGYPKCLLCRENEGYAGRINHPARQNHRIIPVQILGQEWGFQYSPYVYYNEHCILFNGEHIPMKIDRSAFAKLFDFVRQYPHYFIGSNADLPIVGGSILSHEHFQGGHYTFAMAKAPIEEEILFDGYNDIQAGIVKWPMSVIRLRGENTERIVDLADRILTAWRAYTDEEAFIFASTKNAQTGEEEPHNTITPIARMADGAYEMDLVLRNNITTEEHPLGVYHPHAELHHIKKENIGLIEVMGLAVLPARLKDELEQLEQAILEGRDIHGDEQLAKHADWVEELRTRHADMNRENITDILREEIGMVFAKVLEHAGVYKRNAEGREAFLKFVRSV